MASIGYPISRTEIPVQAQADAVPVPWYVWCVVASLTSAVFGMHWDASWHRSIGRDTFWTPAHMAIYACGVLSGISCAYLILKTTFAKNASALRAHSVEIFGLRGPLGSFMAAWGGICLLVSAPFDNWWHSAYGLDVRFVSPPHLMVSLGLWFVMMGSILLVLSYLNRAAAGNAGYSVKKMQRLLLYMGGLVVIEQLFVCFSYTWDMKLHQATPYIAVGMFVPIALGVFWTTTRHPWANTIMAAFYTLSVIVMIQFFPLFPATPRLGPVLYPVTHFVPPRFPQLILFSAIALDIFWQRSERWNIFIRSAVSGFLFTALYVAAEWPFANFLLSPAARNRFFATTQFGFSDVPGPMPAGQWAYELPAHGLHLLSGLLFAAVCAAIGVWAGMTIGRMLQRVRR
jgi:hypothetical protein